MPEGDTIRLAADALQRALAGRRVTRFLSVYPHLTRVDAQTPLAGRSIERVTARGKHLLIWFSGDLVLRTHMRMHGRWRVGAPGRYGRSPAMRILITADDVEAAALDVPTAELVTPEALSATLEPLGPDALADTFDEGEAVRRLSDRGDRTITDALLDQQAMAGVGNIYRSEALFAARVYPFTRVADLSREDLTRVVRAAVALLRSSVNRGLARHGGNRVYLRTGQPCRRCGTPIRRAETADLRRATFWCPRCQPAPGEPTSRS